MIDMEDIDGGLAHDIPRLLERRRVLKLFGVAGLASVVGCGSGSGETTTAPASTATTGATTASTAGATTTTAAATTTAATTASSAVDATVAAASCEAIAPETAGPYPGDGSNGPNALAEAGIVRSDIRSSVGAGSGTADGVPLTINLTIQDLANDCAAYTGAAVYLWHCDRLGRYSLYSEGVTVENYLRGVQEADADGRVSFASIFPGAYSGRWPHVHFEVYPSLADATSAANPITTSQLALPQEACEAVYASEDYAHSAQNFAQTSLESDMVFEDGVTSQLATTSGDVDAGFTAELAVPV